MSSTYYKFILRFKLKNVESLEDYICVLNQMDLTYDLHKDSEGNPEYIWEIEDDHWDNHRGIETGTEYLDYVVAKDEYAFMGKLSFSEIDEIINKIPKDYRPDKNNIRIVSYGYYNGTDEPEVF